MSYFNSISPCTKIFNKLQIKEKLNLYIIILYSKFIILYYIILYYIIKFRCHDITGASKWCFNCINEALTQTNKERIVLTLEANNNSL